VVIGADLPLTGAHAHIGEVYAQALQLRIDQINQRQIAGHHVELRVLDNRSDHTVATDNLTALTADPDIVAVITAGCVPCLVDASQHDLAVPTISLDTEDVLAATPQTRWLFRLGPDAGDNADKLSQTMADHGIHTVALVHTTDLYGLAGDRELHDATTRDHIDIVTRERIPPDANNDQIQAAAEAIATWQPPPQTPEQFHNPFPNPQVAGQPDEPSAGDGLDAVVIWTGPDHAAALATARRETGYTGHLYLDLTAVDQLISPHNPVFTPATAVATATINPDIATTPAARHRADWFATYLSATGHYHLASGFAADAADLITHAIATADQPTRQAVRDRIETTTFDGTTGIVRFTPDQHSGLHPASLTTLTATEQQWR